jgi:hypothetical protein
MLARLAKVSRTRLRQQCYCNWNGREAAGQAGSDSRWEGQMLPSKLKGVRNMEGGNARLAEESERVVSCYCRARKRQHLHEWFCLASQRTSLVLVRIRRDHKDVAAAVIWINTSGPPSGSLPDPS